MAWQKHRIPLCCLFLLYSCLSFSYGEEFPDNDAMRGISLEDLLNIEVTARKVKENLQETPITMSVMSEQFIKDRSLDNILQASYFLPNIDVTTVGENSGCTHCANITIRGVGQVNPQVTIDPSVGIYSDGVYHARSSGGIFQFLDIERVEVMRGPQGTFFGKNTIGGAISIVSHSPTNELAASGKVLLGNENRLDGKFIANVPLSDKWLSRVAISSQNSDGFVERLNGEQQGDRNDISVRAKLLWLANEDTELEITFEKHDVDSGSAPSSLPQKNDEAALISLFNFVASETMIIEPIAPLLVFDDPHINASEGTNTNSLDQWTLSATLDWHLSNDIHLKAITAYHDSISEYGRDFDNNAVNIGETIVDDSQHQFSQEIQFTGKTEMWQRQLSWLVGAFYFDEKAFDKTEILFFEGLYAGLEALPGPLDGSPLSDPTNIGGSGNPLNVGLDLDLTVSNWVDITSYALYAHGSFQVSTPLSVTTGLRITHEKKKQQVVSTANQAGIFQVNRTDETAGQEGGGPIKKSWTVLSPKVGVEYRWDEDIMWYLSASRGFKSGGFNGTPTTNSAARAFDPEYLTAYELGLKSLWFDNHLLVNAAIFHMLHSDKQLRGGVSTEEGIEIFIDNVGKTEIDGVEVEFKTLPLRGFEFSGSVSYTESEFTEVGSANQVTIDSELLRTPEWTMALSALYRWELTNQGSVAARIDWAYRSKSYFDVFNSELAIQPALSLVNLRVDYQVNPNIEISAFVTNATDKQYNIGANDFTEVFGVAEYYLARPREWGVEFSYHF